MDGCKQLFPLGVAFWLCFLKSVGSYFFLLQVFFECHGTVFNKWDRSGGPVAKAKINAFQLHIPLPAGRNYAGCQSDPMGECSNDRVIG